ncbi:hypothetical protein [Cellulomonas wangsupingiae]|uniref:hypothetical protein n=1 Tax=Cellulomonas wangsupingiae TaxID=2968085 RepID=UPI001D0DDAE9|nr:hypothetical protein [Cellulomonas wangsupingiae]MCM0639320.1 hypothetical protein [Cellulomonas wangsupingiae]
MPMNEHVEVALGSAFDTAHLLSDVSKATDPLAEVERRIDDTADQLVAGVYGYEPMGAVETVRMMTLPFARAGGDGPSIGAEGGHAFAEIITIAILFAASTLDGDHEAKRVDQDVCGVISETLIPLAQELLTLANVRDILAANHSDDMAQVAATVRGNGRWMRGTSYPDMHDEALRGLFGQPDIDAGLREILGFGVDDALSFLSACHQMQMDQFNERGRGLSDAFNLISPMELRAGRIPTEAERRQASDAFAGLFNPSADQAAIAVVAVADRAGLSQEVAIKVTEFFTAPPPPDGPREALRRYLDGNSPLRAHPLVSRDGLVMAVHPALFADAVKVSFEDALNGTTHWETYALHRGKYLEARVSAHFKTLIPGVTEYHGLEYFVPLNESEESGGAAGYTKLVEGDHLFVLHDVAFIVEDKAIPLSERARTGEVNPLRRNLAKAITKGADQAGRMKQRIIEDHGLRLRDDTWLDLPDVREVHSVVTSLDDMPGIATATATLVKANRLAADSIPWTVSLNDLGLIAKLVDRSAEFLLYVRRRTHPRSTRMFMAVDELDLFLLFLRRGLYVEPDPEVAAREMPWLGKPRPADLRRYKKQTPALVLSHTDELDAWYASRDQTPGTSAGAIAPKPRMTPSPLTPLIDTLCRRDIFGWLSIGATLLEGSSDMQRRMAGNARQLISNPAPNGKPRSLAIPWGLNKQDGWLLVWMTRPAALDGERVLRHAFAYMLAKKHQLGFRRGVAFVYDEPTGELIDALYDSGQAAPDSDILATAVDGLRPLGEAETQAQSTQRRRAAERAEKSSSKRKAKKRRR